MASNLWKRITAALDPTPDAESYRYDYDEEARLPQVMEEVLIEVEPVFSRPSWNETLDSNVPLFEDCAQDLLMDTASFRAIEHRLNVELGHLNAKLAQEVRYVDMDLVYDPQEQKFAVVGQFERHAPFDVFFSGRVVETDRPLSAIYAHFRPCDSHNPKMVTLNRVINNDERYPYRIADGYIVTPSTLTLLLKYAIRRLDGDQLLEPNGEMPTRWPRGFGSAALMFDLMRHSTAWREACAHVMTRHCNEFYRVPADLALALQEHLRLQQDPYYASSFSIALEFEPHRASNVYAKLTACYF